MPFIPSFERNMLYSLRLTNTHWVGMMKPLWIVACLLGQFGLGYVTYCRKDEFNGSNHYWGRWNGMQHV